MRQHPAHWQLAELGRLLGTPSILPSGPAAHPSPPVRQAGTCTALWKAKVRQRTVLPLKVGAIGAISVLRSMQILVAVVLWTHWCWPCSVLALICNPKYTLQSALQKSGLVALRAATAAESPASQGLLQPLCLDVHLPPCLQQLTTEDLCKGEQVFFAATGVSDGDLLRGVRYFSGGASSNSIVMRTGSGTGGRSRLLTGRRLEQLLHRACPCCRGLNIA